MCHAELVSSDKYFTGFRLASPPAAQTEVFVLVRPTATQTGDYDCDEASIDGGEAIYVASRGTTQLEFAGGKGVHVAAGQYIQLVTHLVNSSGSGVNGTTTVEGRVAAAKDVTTPIDMFIGGKLGWQIPTGTGTINGSCGVDTATHVVALVVLMRSLGVHQAVTMTDPSAVSLLDTSFDPAHVLYTSLTSDFELPVGSQLFTSCTYANNTGSVVNEGEGTDQEMCLSGIYRYPPKPPTNTSPIDCARGFPI